MNDPGEVFITPAQIRAGRAMLGWSQKQLARAAQVGLSTVKDVENGKRKPTKNNLGAIRRTLEEGGVEFIPGNGHGQGIRLKTNRPEIIRRPFTVGEEFRFLIRWRFQEILVRVPRQLLEGADIQELETFDDYMDAFRRNEERILVATMAAIEANMFDANGFLQLAPGAL